MPYLIDKVLGLSAAIVLSIVLVVGGGAFLWSAHRSRPGKRPKIKIAEVLGFAVSFVTLVVLVSIGILRAMPKTESVKDVPKAITPERSPTHTLLVRYIQGSLPIRIVPKDVAYILQLNPNITQWVWEIPNPSQKAITWPSDVHPLKGGPPGDFIYVCELTNHEDKTFLNVSVPFEVSFYESEMVPITFTEDKNGRQLTGIPRPGPDHVIYLGVKDGKKIAARDGALVKTFGSEQEFVEAQ